MTKFIPHEIDEAVSVGKLTLYRVRGFPKLFIEITDDGEGGEFDETELAKVIEKFYNENF